MIERLKQLRGIKENFLEEEILLLMEAVIEMDKHIKKLQKDVKKKPKVITKTVTRIVKEPKKKGLFK